MQDETDIWSYIPVADFDAPTPPASDAARGGVRRLWKSLQGVFQRPQKNVSNDELQWDRPSAAVLNSVSPDPNWKQAATLLAAELGDDWFEKRQPAHPPYALIGPPGCDIGEVLQTLAQDRQLNVLATPAADEILAASKSNTSALNAVDESDGELLVIPHLEHWYLRHEDGLSLIRMLIERLISSRRRVLVGCDSWAWAFLQYAAGIEDLLGEPHTLAPFDAKRLDAWFRSTCDFRGREFRQCGDGEPVFPELPKAETTNTKQPQREYSNLLRSLAARARGNPGVALALWRASLRRRDPDSDADAPPADTSQTVFWSVSPAELAIPQLSGTVDRVHRFVLHSILLHGGLSLSSLATLLPFSSTQIQRHVSLMRRAGILEEQNDRLRVSLTAYPFVRHDLLSDGFLTDAF